MEVTAANLQALSNTGVAMADAQNAAGTIAGTAVTSGDFTYVDSDMLIVGTVNGTMGVTGADAINISTVGGSLTVSNVVTAGGGATDHVTLATGATGGADTIALNAAVSAAGADLRLNSADDIAQTVEVTAASLQALSNTGVSMTDAQNAVGTIAGTATVSGNFNYVDANALIVDTVNGTVGVTVAGVNVINITTLAGSLAVDRVLNAAGGSVTLDSSAGITDGASGTILTTNLNVIADGTVLLDGAASDVSGVLAANLTGAGAADAFSFTDLAGTLTVGTFGSTGIQTAGGAVNLTTAGGVLQVDQVVNAIAGNVTLNSSAGITDAVAGQISGTNLNVIADGTVLLDSGLHNVALIAANLLTAPGNFTYADATGVAIGTFGSTGIQTTNGFIDVTSTGTLTVNSIVSAGGTNNVLLTTNNTGGTDTLAMNAAVSAAGAEIRLNSADNVTQGAGSVAASALQVLAQGQATLGLAANNVVTVASAITVNPGGFTYSDIDALSIGMVNGTPGIATLNGPVVLSFGQGGGATLNMTSPTNAGLSSVTINGGAGSDMFNIDQVITSGTTATFNGGIGDDTFNLNVGLAATGISTFDGDADSDTFDFVNGLYVDVVDGGTGGTDVDVLDFVDSSTDLIFAATGPGAGTVSTAGPVLQTTYMDVEQIKSGTGNDLFSNNASYTLTGVDQGIASSLNGGAGLPGPTWTGIENLGGTGAAAFLIGGDEYTLTGQNTGTTPQTVGVNIRITGIWSNIGNLIGTGAATDVLMGGDEYTVSGSDSGTTPNNNAAIGNFIDGTWSMLANLIGTNGADTFDIDDNGLLSGTIRDNGGGTDTLTYGARTTGGAVTVNLQTGAASFINSGAANGFLIGEIDNFVGGATGLDDTLIGPDQVAANTVQWTLNGGPDETVTDAITQTFTGFEILQAGADVDDFNINASLTFTEIRGGAGADVFDLFDLAAPTTVGIDLMADIFGEAGNDQINFGVPRTPPITPDTSGDRSQLVGTVDLGADNDTIDFSGAQQVGFMSSLISVSFIDVETIIGNNSAQLNGPVGDTDWLITDVGTGEYNTAGPNFGAGSGSTEFQNLSILGGPGIDRFFFGPDGVIPGGGTGQSVSITGVGPTGGQNGTILTGGANTGIDAGGGANVLVGSTAADTFTITGPNAVTIDVGVPAPSTLLNIQNIDGTLTSTFTAPTNMMFAEAGDVGTDAGADVFNLNVVTWAGFINGGLGSDTININAVTNDTATITAIDPASLTSAVNNFTGTGGFTGIEILNTGLGNDTITLAVAPADPTIPARNQLNLGGGVDTITTALATDWLITGNGAGFVRDITDVSMRVQFSGVDNLISTAGAASNLTMPNVGPGGSISGAFTAAAGVTLTPGAIFVGNTNDFRINAPVTAAGTTSITASGANDIDINGGLTLAAGNFTSSTSTGTAFYQDIYTAGNQTYSGPTEFAAGGLLEVADGRTTARALELATLRGANLTFNGPTNIVGQVLMESSTNRFDFDAAAGQVTSAGDAVLGLLPTPATDLFFDLVPNMPGHINSNSFGAFQGTFCGGCEFLPNPTDPTDTFNGALTQVNADYIGIAEPFMTSGNIVMAGSVIEFAPTTTSTMVNLAAGNPGDGDIALIALGTQLQPANDGFGGVDPNGDIIAPAAQEVTITGGRALLASTNEIVNSEQILLQLGSPPGEILVTQGDAANTVVDFKIGSLADDSNSTDTDTLTILNSVAQLISTGAFAGFGAAGVSFSDITSAQQSIVSIFNPAAVLTLLQAISFLDASAFESELSLFGIIGEGIAQSLDQCEDAEGCAPSVTEEELAGFIEILNERITRLEGMLSSGDIDAEDGRRLLA